VYDQIKNKLVLGYEYVGEQTVKNIKEPIRVYRVLMEPGIRVPEGVVEKKGKPKKWRRTALPMGIILFVVAAAVAVWLFYLRSTLPPREVASKEKMAFPLPDKPSIAVLPFVNMSEDPKQEYFSDGMTEDLITDLSKISGLLVIARNSTFTYKGKPVKVKQVAEELGVRYVLEGSVRRADDEIRINAQLIDALSGNHLWAERYDGKTDRIFALQDQITQKIVSALAVKLTGTEEQIIAQKGTDNIAAYDAYLEGMDHYYRYTPDSSAKAAAFFKKAIELDPNYGQAYAALASVHSLVTLNTALLPGLKISWLEARLRMREYIQMAMKKPTSSAYAVSSEMYLNRRQHKEAISELERGLSLNPNSAACHGDMGFTLTWAGKPKEGIEYLNKWIRLDPRARYRYLRWTSWAHFWMGETAEAANLSEQALRLNPENLSAAVELAGFYGALGRDQDARAMLEIRKKGALPPDELWQVLRQNPFSDRTVADRYARGLLKAGLPPGKVSGGYFPAFKENQLTGEEIKKLLFGSKITGINLSDGQQWWTDHKKNGECTWRGSGPISSDTGMSRIEGDMICSQYQKRLWALEYCGTVFRNPGGKHGSKDEYFLCSDIGPIPFSLVK
jgi:TolB-like protein